MSRIEPVNSRCTRRATCGSSALTSSETTALMALFDEIGHEGVADFPVGAGNQDNWFAHGLWFRLAAGPDYVTYM